MVHNGGFDILENLIIQKKFIRKRKTTAGICGQSLKCIQKCLSNNMPFNGNT